MKVQAALPLWRLAGSAALILSLWACRSAPSPAENSPAGPGKSLAASASAGGPSSDRPGPQQAPPPTRVLLDLYDRLERCELHHRGELIDFGTPAIDGRLGWGDPKALGLESLERDASTWSKVYEKKLDLSFVLTDPTRVFVATRIVGQASSRVGVYVDDHLLGTLASPRGQVRVASVGPTVQPLEAGSHRLTLRFPGPNASLAEEPRAEIDWVRIGLPDELTQTYGPPTLDATRDGAAALAGVPHRSLAVRSPGSVRCALRVPQESALRVAVGLRGPGEGQGTVRLWRDGQAPQDLATYQLTGGPQASWTDLRLPLQEYAGQLVSLEFGVAQNARGSQVLFGDPAIVTSRPLPAPVPPAKAVVLVVLDGVTRQECSPWGREEHVTPELASLARSSVVFDRHRAPSTLTLPAMATLLTGLLPREHTVTDRSARLPASTATLGRIAREASVRTALLTGVPWSFGAFGFRPAWERFTEYTPSSGDPATAPLDDAGAWLTQALKETPESRFLAVVHARGGHPPWDVSPKVVATLPPLDYPGLIEPRRAAQVLSTLSKKRVNADIAPPDRERLLALATLALTAQDRAVGGLIAALREASLWDQTLFIVTGLVAAGAGDPAPYGEGRDLSEAALALPLLVHFPGDALAARRTDEPTDLRDITRTAAAALGLTLPAEVQGHDLAQLVTGLPEASLDPQMATLGDQYSVRSGPFVLSGKAGAPPALCDVGLDPTCTFDRRPIQPLTTQALYRHFVSLDLLHRASPGRREGVSLDPETDAALKVWGAILSE